MFLSILGIIGLIAVIYLGKWWEDENIDKGSMTLTGGGTESEVNRATEKRKSEKRAKLEAEVRRLNEQHPDRLFYRDGPRVREHAPEEVAAIRECERLEEVAAIRQCERLNAPYKSSYPHYAIEHGRVEYDEFMVNIYKYEAKRRELENDFDNPIQCDFDAINMRLINKITGEEIPFDPDSYTLPPDHFR